MYLNHAKILDKYAVQTNKYNEWHEFRFHGIRQNNGIILKERNSTKVIATFLQMQCMIAIHCVTCTCNWKISLKCSMDANTKMWPKTFVYDVGSCLSEILFCLIPWKRNSCHSLYLFVWTAYLSNILAWFSWLICRSSARVRGSSSGFLIKGKCLLDFVCALVYI
jgi:hypothetical protein